MCFGNVEESSDLCLTDSVMPMAKIKSAYNALQILTNSINKKLWTVGLQVFMCLEC